MVNVDLYSAIIAKVSNALNTLVSSEKRGFQALSKKKLTVLLCAEVVRQGVPDHGAVHSECHLKMHTDLITVRGGMTFSVCPSVGACVRACLIRICLPACCQPPVLRCGVSVNFYKASVLSAQFYKCLLLHS